MEYESMHIWNIKDALNKYAPFSSPKKVNSSKLKGHSSTEISQDRLRQSYKIAAYAVKEYGDIYLKIFERLHNEIDDYETKNSLLNTAFKIANKKQED